LVAKQQRFQEEKIGTTESTEYSEKAGSTNHASLNLLHPGTSGASGRPGRGSFRLALSIHPGA
jgi:hypothetical protein